jgi:hypothetical protein
VTLISPCEKIEAPFAPKHNNLFATSSLVSPPHFIKATMTDLVRFKDLDPTIIYSTVSKNLDPILNDVGMNRNLKSIINSCNFFT